MTRDETDTLWQKALHQSVKDGEQFTRYHFAALVAAHEREECAKECERMVMYPNARCESAAHDNVWKAAAAIRARGETK